MLHGRRVVAKHEQFYITERHTWGAALTNGDKDTLYHREQYDGMVYCVSVPNETLLVRRNNLPMFAGNCVRYTAMYYVKPTKESVHVRPAPHPFPFEADIRRTPPEGLGDWRDHRPRPRIPGIITRGG